MRATGFMIRELFASCAIVSAAVCVVAVIGDAGRRAATSSETLNNLRTLHGAYMAVGVDRQDEFPTFTWRAGENPTQHEDLRFSESDLQAAANQATDILRRRGTRNMPKYSGWIPHVLYNYLVLADALDWSLPAANVIPPDDAVRQCWIRHLDDPDQCEDVTFNLKAVYSSPYVQPVVFFSSPDSGPDAIVQTGNCCYFVTNNVAFGGRRFHEVVYPSDKAYLFDNFMRGDRPLYYMFEEARVPVARVDGSAAFQTTSESNIGWNPRDPGSGEPSRIPYRPGGHGDPDLPPGFDNNVAIAHYGYTRGALAGRDFDGPEAPLP